MNREDFQALSRSDDYHDGYNDGYEAAQENTKEFVYKRLLMKGFTEQEARQLSGKL